jgi:hypothetical protein
MSQHFVQIGGKNQPAYQLGCIQLVQGIFGKDSASQRLTQVQRLVSAFDLTIPPINKDAGTSPVLASIAILNDVQFGVQHERAAGICSNLYSCRYYYCGNKVTFVTIDDHSNLVIVTFGKLVDEFNVQWQVHRLQKRYFGRLEWHRKSFIDGMADEVESLLDRKAHSTPAYLVPLTKVVGGVEVTIPRVVTIADSLRPLRTFVNEAYREVVVQKRIGQGSVRKRYFVDYTDGRAAGKIVYRQVFGNKER